MEPYIKQYRFMARVQKLIGGMGILLLLLLQASPSVAQEKDTLFLYNGQILIGDITAAQLGMIYIDEVDLRKITVKMYKIRTLKTSGQFRIETADREIIFGSLEASSRNGWTDIYSGDDLVASLEINSINLIFSLEQKFWKRTNGELSAGFSYTKSSDLGQITLNARLLYFSKRVGYQFTGSEYIAIDSGKFSRDKEQYELFVDYTFHNTWLVAGLINYQRNLELSLARRLQQMAGVGNKLFIRRNWQLIGISGLTFNQEKSTEGVSSGLLLEIPLMLRFNFFSYRQPNLQISTSPAGYISLSQKGRFRFDGVVSISYELTRDFYLKIDPYTNYDSKPPSGENTFDFGFSIGLSYKF